jgi:hypothetical protein
MSLARRHYLGQIGHEDFHVFPPIVAPIFAEHRCDVSQMAQPHAFGKDPERAVTVATNRGDMDFGILPAWQVGDQILDNLPIAQLPTTGEHHHIPVAERLDAR